MIRRRRGGGGGGGGGWGEGVGGSDSSLSWQPIIVGTCIEQEQEPLAGTLRVSVSYRLE